MTLMPCPCCGSFKLTDPGGFGTRLPEIDALIRDELGRAGELSQRKLRDRFVDRANDLFLELVNT